MEKTSETYFTLSKGTEHFISQQWELFVETSYLYRDQELRENYFLQRQSGFHSWGGGELLTFYHLKLLFKIWNTVNENHNTKVRQFQTYVLFSC